MKRVVEGRGSCPYSKVKKANIRAHPSCLPWAGPDCKSHASRGLTPCAPCTGKARVWAQAPALPWPRWVEFRSVLQEGSILATPPAPSHKQQLCPIPDALGTLLASAIIKETAPDSPTCLPLNYVSFANLTSLSQLGRRQEWVQIRMQCH